MGIELLKPVHATAFKGLPSALKFAFRFLLNLSPAGRYSREGPEDTGMLSTAALGGSIGGSA